MIEKKGTILLQTYLRISGQKTIRHVEQCLGLQTSFYSIRMATFFDKYFILRIFQIFIMDLAKH